METGTDKRILQIPGSLPKKQTDASSQELFCRNSDAAGILPIPPGSVFEDRIPLGRQPKGAFWCPDGVPNGRTTALLSSRLGRGAFDNAAVSRAVRGFFATLDHESLLATASGVTMDPALQRGSQLFGIPLLRFLPFPKTFNKAVATELQSSIRHPNEFRVFFESASSSGCDQLLLEICENCRLVSVRKDGNLHKAIRDRAEYDASSSADNNLVLCLVDPELTPARVRDELQTLGCHDWWLYSGDGLADSQVDDDSNPQKQGIAAGKHSRDFGDIDAMAPIVALAEIDEDLLSHWTRPAMLSWPDRNALSQWDVVWFGEQAPDGAAGTLLRILAMQSILGSGRLIRGGQPMCCFTEVPLMNFANKRVFRAHLSRWDFEPFGISIRRSALESIGGRPVRYATTEASDPTNKSAQAWQVTGDSAADWSQEREWRVEGNVDLRVLPADSVFVFVPDMETAKIVRPFSRWPVVVIGNADNTPEVIPQ